MRFLPLSVAQIKGLLKLTNRFSLHSVSIMSESIRVRVQSGVLEGKLCENDSDAGREYFSFQGIPYAKPPIGELRFKAPQPVEPWEGVRDATEDGEQCYSRHPVNKNLKFGSENCLFLNVYTPKLPHTDENQTRYDLKPVMFFIHGGAFTTGSNSKGFYGPDFLIREDVVIVTTNYRIGLLGFLSLQDTSLDVPGNAGLKDVVMALKWVRNNIKNFNGDPENVTIFGESAGAAAVHLLVLSPSANGTGLFHKAICQSGCALNPWARCGKTPDLLAEFLGIDRNDEEKLLHALNDLKVEELHDLQEKLPDTWKISQRRYVGFTVENPVQKGEPFLAEDPLEILKKGTYNRVPILIGFTSREGMLIHASGKRDIQELIPEVEQNVPHDLGLTIGTSLSKKVAQKIMEFYFGEQDPFKADIDLYYKLLSDNMFIRDVYKTAKIHARTTSEPIFLYEMTVETSMNLLKRASGISTPGVCHADDLFYLFKTAVHGDIEPNSVEDITIRRFCKLWTNFAKYSNPNSPSQDPLLLEMWKPFVGGEECYLEIDKELSSKTKPANDRMKFWEEIYSNKNTIHKL